jgi:uncharacterized protein YutD
MDRETMERDRMDREYHNSIVNTERFNLSRSEISSLEFYECVLLFKDKVFHLQMTMADVGNASVRAIIKVIEPIQGDFIHDIQDEPEIREETFWCLGIYITGTDMNWKFLDEWMAMIFKSVKYAGEQDNGICSNIGNVEYEYIWPAAEEAAKTCIKLPKFEDKLYERNCEIVSTVASAAWKAALLQDSKVLDALKKRHDEEIQKIDKCRKRLTKSKKISAINLIDSCISSLEQLLNFIPQNSLDVFKAYYLYGAWEIIEVVVNMIQIAQDTLCNFKEKMILYKISNRISEVYSDVQYFIREFNLSDLFINLELNFSNHLSCECTGLISNLTDIIIEYCDFMFVNRKIFISRLFHLLNVEVS